jgi:PAS domain S-box-containing protein
MSKTLRVLIVEDCEDDATLLKLELRRSGYDLIFERVWSAGEMSTALGSQSWDLVISDYAMPGFNGLGALRMVQESGLDIPFILISGTVGEETAVGAMKAGASDYLIKGSLTRLGPVVERELREAADRRQRKQAQRDLLDSEARFRSLSASSPIGVFQTDSNGRHLYANERCQSILGLTQQELLAEGGSRVIHPEDLAELTAKWSIATLCTSEFSHEFRIVLPEGELRWAHSRAVVLRGPDGSAAGFVGTLEDITERKRSQDEIRRSHAELATAYDATLEGWVRALDLRDNETEGHTQRVTEMTLRLASRAGLADEELVHIRRGALLHDIGKVGIPDAILLKPGKLTEDEWLIMKRHPVYAYQWLAPISYLAPCLDIPYCHHEKWDGTGYPHGLAKEQIPLSARLFAIVDVWDALRSDRPYRKGWPDEAVRSHIASLSGTHFDPDVVEMFLELISAQAAYVAAA